MYRISLFLVAFAFLSKITYAQTTRLSLLEEFTGETCGPCAATNPGLNATLAANATKVIAIKWQVPIPTAPTNTWSLYQTNAVEINARTSFYAVNSAPQGRMDGQSLTVFGASSDHAANVNNTLISAAQAVTSPFSITMLRDWDATCSSVNLTITVQASTTFSTASTLSFRTVMVERLIQFSVQPGSNGETTFSDVAIKSFPNIQSGYALATNWVAGQVQTFTLNCPIPSYTRDKNEIAFVGFIQNGANKQVLQAARVDKVPLPPDAITALDAKVDVTCSSSITPQISIRNDGSNALTSFTINPFADALPGTPTTWSGNLAVGTSTTLILNSIATSTALGAHTFSYQLLMGAQYNLVNISNNKVKYLVASSFQNTPVIEDFALATFPPQNWVAVNPNNGPAWSRVVTTGSYGNSSDFGTIKFDFYNNAVIGDEDDLYLPPLDLSGSLTPTLTFDLAKASRGIENDQLDVLVSNNCGATWMNVYSKAGSGLATSAAITTPFQALLTQDWITETVPLFGFATANVLIKFRATSNNGNNLYIDNINISQLNPVGIHKLNANVAGSTLFPNPAGDETTLTLKSNSFESYTIKVINAIGQIILQNQVDVTSGTTNLKLDTKDFTNGIYFIVISSAKNAETKKLIIAK